MVITTVVPEAAQIPWREAEKSSVRKAGSDGISLRDLIKFLDEGGRVHDPILLQYWLSALKPNLEELAPYVQFGDDTYRRNLVCRREEFEVLVLCWKTSQYSPIHDHKGSFCGVRVLSGCATEVRFDRLDGGQLQASCIQPLPAGSVTASADEDMHVVANWAVPKQDLVTLHVYLPPMTKMERYPDAIVVPAKRDAIKKLAPPSNVTQPA